MKFKETELITSKIKILKDLGLLSEKTYSNRLLPTSDREYILTEIINELKSDWIYKVTGYFMNHRESNEYANLNFEDKVQDLTYIQLIKIISDLHYEDPQSKTKGSISHTRIDFSSNKLNLGIEIKHAKDKHNAKQIEAEISEDIVKYGKSKRFKTIIFFIYCYNYNFPNPIMFANDFTFKQTINDFLFETICIIK